MKKISVAILGIGTVGGGTYEILTKEREMIKKTQGLDIEVKAVLDKSVELAKKRTSSGQGVTTSISDIAFDNDIDIVVETMGGITPAKEFILACLKNGKKVVTANKELLAKHGAQLEEAASEGGGILYFEASVAGGIPVIRVLEDGMQANNIVEIMGIINGTTNFILTKMQEEGEGYQAVLKEAQRLGFAEADPTADVEGFDASYKLSILLSMAFHSAVPYTKIYREGISAIKEKDIKNAEALGYRIKLLAIGKRVNGGIEARVHPCFVPISHPLAAVRNEFNAVFLKGDSVDDIMLYGRGAGAFPTASAIVSDIITAIKTPTEKTSFFNAKQSTNIISDFESAYYLALTVLDKAGVLSKITEIFAKNKVSISQMVQEKAKGGSAELSFLTHTTTELSMQKAIMQIKKLLEVKAVDSLVRVL